VRVYIKVLAFLFFIINHSVFSNSNPQGIDAKKPLSSLIMDQWTGQHGLVSNNLTSVFQSSSHFIWITTFNGILRFDGINFELFDKSTLPFLSSNGFYRTYEDSKGNLWFTSQSSGVVKYDGSTFHQIVLDDKRSLSVRSIAEDQEGNIWLGTNNQGLFKYDHQKLQKIGGDKLDFSIIMDILMKDKNEILIATNSDGLYRLQGEELSKVVLGDDQRHTSITELYQSTTGTIYVGTLNGLFFLNDIESGEISQLSGIAINHIEMDDYRNIWIASEQGLFMVNPDTDEFKSFTDKDGLPGTQVSWLCFDHENSLWVSTKKAGLLRFREGFFINISVDEGLSSNNVNIVVEDQGKFFVGCDDGSIGVVSDGEVEKLPIHTSDFNQGIRDIHFESNGEMLIVSYSGLLKKKGNSETLIDLRKYGASNDIRRLLKDDTGTIWLATRSSGVIKMTTNGDVKVFNSSNGLESDYILALEKDQNGNILVGTHSGGVSIISDNDELRNLPVENGKAGILIFNIHPLPNDEMFIATNIGIYKYMNGDFKKIVLDSKLNAETIFDLDIVNNEAWLTSNKGLIKAAVPDITSFLDGNIEFVEGRLFDRFDGMASQECTAATRFTVCSEEKIWIPTLGGVAILNPTAVRQNSQVPKVFITDFLTDFELRSTSGIERLSLTPGIVRYEFKFTSLSFIAPPKVQFRYRLSGLDKKWIDAGTEREVVYTNLPKGNYTFEVIASNNDGIWNEQGDNIQFRVEPFFYETLAFYVGVVTLIGLLVWGIIVLRVRAIEKRNAELKKLNEELDRFVYSASHDLRAPLSSVLGLVEIARLEDTIEAKQKCLDMINESVVKLDGFINDIIDYSRNQRIEIKPEVLNIKDEINEALSELRYLDKESKIEKIVESDEEATFVTDGRRLNIILKNIISNAIRYHNLNQSSPFIKIGLKYDADEVEISISDNGIGIDGTHLDNIFKMFYRADESSKGSGLGLYIVKETIDKIGGAISVDSTLNFGTTFTIRLKSLKTPAGMV